MTKRTTTPPWFDTRRAWEQPVYLEANPDFAKELGIAQAKRGLQTELALTFADSVPKPKPNPISFRTRRIKEMERRQPKVAAVLTWQFIWAYLLEHGPSRLKDIANGCGVTGRRMSSTIAKQTGRFRRVSLGVWAIGDDAEKMKGAENHGTS